MPTIIDPRLIDVQQNIGVIFYTSIKSNVKGTEGHVMHISSVWASSAPVQEGIVVKK